MHTGQHLLSLRTLSFPFNRVSISTQCLELRVRFHVCSMTNRAARYERARFTLMLQSEVTNL